MNAESLIQDIRQSKLRLAQAISVVENEEESSFALLDQIFPHTGKARLIGITGSPGVGKSSLVNKLVLQARKDQPARKIAVVAVDPSSPFTGGAILGDRIRMRELSGDDGLFIRSMASRGMVGGLSRTTRRVCQVLDAAGYEWIIIETVGAGQAEVEIARLAQTTIVVEAPGLGDEIQTFKAGILEIADILALNKSDLPGAEQTFRALRAMLVFAEPDAAWKVPIIRTNSVEGEGIIALLEAIDAHHAYLQGSGVLERKERLQIEQDLKQWISHRLEQKIQAQVPSRLIATMVEDIQKRRITPFAAVEELMKRL